MDIDEFVEMLTNYANNKDLWGEGICLMADGNEVTGFVWDGNTSINLIMDEG